MQSYIIRGKRREEYDTNAGTREWRERRSEALSSGAIFRSKFTYGEGISVDHVYFSPKIEYPLHKHEKLMELFFVISGVVKIRGDGGTITLKENQMHTVRPGVVHGISNEESEYATLFCIKFLPSNPPDFAEILKTDRVGIGPGNEPPEEVQGD